MSAREFIFGAVLFSMFNAASAQLGDVPMPTIAPKTETGPSLEETQKWLIEKVAEYDKYEFPVRYHAGRQGEKDHWEHALSFNGCNVVYSHLDNMYSYSSGLFFSGNEWRYKEDEPGRYIVSLADLDPERVKVVFAQTSTDIVNSKGETVQGQYIIVAETLANKPAVRSEQPVSAHTGTRGDTSYLKMFRIFFIRDAAVADRMKNGLQHAIKLCRTIEGEKEQRKPRKNEPF